MAILDIDHLMMDVVRAGTLLWFEQAGFTVRPLRAHAIMGGGDAGGEGGSAVITFSAAHGTVANYFELSFADAKHADPQMAKLLPGRPLLSMLMHATDDFPTDLSAWEKTSEFGLQFDLPMEKRGVIRPQTIKAALMTDASAPLPFGICQYEHVDEYKLEELVNHPNGALGWCGVRRWLTEKDFIRQKGLSERLYNRPADMTSEGQALWNHMRTFFDLRVGMPKTEIFIDVADRRETLQFLSYCGLEHENKSEGVQLNAASICGADLIFV